MTGRVMRIEWMQRGEVAAKGLSALSSSASFRGRRCRNRRLYVEIEVEPPARAETAGSAAGGDHEIGRERGKAVLLMVHHTHDTARKQWDDTVTAALGGLSHLLRLQWKALVGSGRLAGDWETVLWGLQDLHGAGRREATAAALGLLTAVLHDRAERECAEGPGGGSGEPGDLGRGGEREGGGRGMADAQGGVGGKVRGLDVGASREAAGPEEPAPEEVIEAAVGALCGLAEGMAGWEREAPLSARLETCRALLKALAASPSGEMPSGVAPLA